MTWSPRPQQAVGARPREHGPRVDGAAAIERSGAGSSPSGAVSPMITLAVAVPSVPPVGFARATVSVPDTLEVRAVHRRHGDLHLCGCSGDGRGGTA